MQMSPMFPIQSALLNDPLYQQRPRPVVYGPREQVHRNGTELQLGRVEPLQQAHRRDEHVMQSAQQHTQDRSPLQLSLTMTTAAHTHQHDADCSDARHRLYRVLEKHVLLRYDRHHGHESAPKEEQGNEVTRRRVRSDATPRENRPHGGHITYNVPANKESRPHGSVQSNTLLCSEARVHNNNNEPPHQNCANSHEPLAMCVAQLEPRDQSLQERQCRRDRT
mmetsp:Transcript_9710/g.27051  ORF Transcript_9710/g.27051 Transcript_9710/m.27051 type:complete len:222 (+) Transcript_9710:916-1581(+)